MYFPLFSMSVTLLVLHISLFVSFFLRFKFYVTLHLSFSIWLTVISMIISRFIHVAANGIISFFFLC